jgi:hypothetical protein
MAIGGNNVYPAIDTVLDLVRSQVLDDMKGATATIGEGQIYVDDMSVSVTLSNFFNSALRELCRDLRTTNGPMLMRDNYILLGLTPINSSQGLAAPNAAVQCYISNAGYFDGTSMNSSLVLPADFLMPDRLWERLNGSNDEFRPMTQCPQALSAVWQGQRFGEFEWRQDRINLHGALTTRDMRIRYFGKLVDLYEPGVDLDNTFIPINDCEEALSDKIVVKISRRISPEREESALAAAKKSLFTLQNEQVKQKQGIEYQPNAYGSEAGPQLGL